MPAWLYGSSRASTTNRRATSCLGWEVRISCFELRLEGRSSELGIRNSELVRSDGHRQGGDDPQQRDEVGEAHEMVVDQPRHLGGHQRRNEPRKEPIVGR